MDEATRVIMHLDMDAFFASVEQLDNPAYRGKPVIVGGGDRGVVCAASYEARKFGVRSAMPSATARRLCPHGIFVRGRMSRYKELSRQVMAILIRTAPVVQQTSVDEAYLDVSGTQRLYGPPEELGGRLKAEIRQATGLTASIGIAPNRFLAKIASDLRKPDGLTLIRPQDVASFLASLPVGKIPGVGAKSLEVLKRLGVVHAADVLRYPPDFWLERLGKWGGVLHDRARGIDHSPVEPGGEPKSSSAENTFAHDLDDPEALRDWLWSQSERVGRDLRRHGLKGRTVTLKLKYDDFTQRSKSRTLPEAVSATKVIYDTAVALLAETPLTRKVRLIGVGVSNFDAGGQLLLVPDLGHERLERLDSAIDAIKDRFGDAVLRRGRICVSSRGPKDPRIATED